jgi:hypothetical protein
MRSFTVGAQTTPRYLHMLAGGMGSNGKTQFASTFPRPLFLSDAAEGGYATLFKMAADPALRALWWDPAVPPEVHAIEQHGELIKEIIMLEGLRAKGKLPYQTLIVDAISIFSDRILNEMKAANPTQDTRQRYGQHNDVIGNFILRVHQLPLHVLWLCHVTEEGELTLPSKLAAKVPAYMDIKWMCSVLTTPGKNPDFQLRTRAFKGATWIGTRYADLPDPIIPSAKPIFELLGLPERPVSPSCPDFGGVSYAVGVQY